MVNGMILYFTGTGNTKYVADVLAEELNDNTVSLNDVIKNNKQLKFSSDKPFIVAAPVYAWRLPKKIEELIKKAEFSGSDKIYFIVTMGAQSGNAYKYCKKLCNNKNLKFMGFYGIPMPDNYVIASKMPDKSAAEQKIKTAEIKIREIAKKIKSGWEIMKDDKSALDALYSGLINPVFNKFAVTSNEYNVSEECICCGECVKLCPTNNISMKDGKPVFGTNCMSCYACIHRCPKMAINIGKKTQSHGRYVCPEYKKL